jgi:hypothetical protein
MKMIVLSLLLLSGCGLTPKQLQALNGGMCTKTSGYGIANITTMTAGPNAPNIDGDTCSITQVSK